MKKIHILNNKAEQVKDIELNAEIFGIKPNKQAIFDSILAERASTRQGTKKTKTKGEVAGGGKKPWAQKHTGRARQGSIRAPQWRGGGIVFGPTGEENYTLKVNKKTHNLAIRSALSQKAIDKGLYAIEAFNFKKPSTSHVIKFLTTLKLEGKTLILLDSTDKDFENVVLSTRNLAKVMTKLITQASVEDFVAAKNILITESALIKIQESL